MGNTKSQQAGSCSVCCGVVRACGACVRSAYAARKSTQMSSDSPIFSMILPMTMVHRDRININGTLHNAASGFSIMLSRSADFQPENMTLIYEIDFEKPTSNIHTSEGVTEGQEHGLTPDQEWRFELYKGKNLSLHININGRPVDNVNAAPEDIVSFHVFGDVRHISNVTYQFAER